MSAKKSGGVAESLPRSRIRLHRTINTSPHALKPALAWSGATHNPNASALAGVSPGNPPGALMLPLT